MKEAWERERDSVSCTCIEDGRMGKSESEGKRAKQGERKGFLYMFIWWLYLAQLKKVLRQFSIATRTQTAIIIIIIIIITVCESLYSHYRWSLRECVETAHGIGTDIGVLVGIVQ